MLLSSFPTKIVRKYFKISTEMAAISTTSARNFGWKNGGVKYWTPGIYEFGMLHDLNLFLCVW